MRRTVIISVALHTLAAVAALLWLLWYFIPTGNVFNGLSTLLILVLAGWYVFKNCWSEVPTFDVNQKLRHAGLSSSRIISSPLPYRG